MIFAVAQVQPNTTVVLHCGVPVEMPWLEQVSAVLWLGRPGEHAGAVAMKLLYEQANPSGHLAVTWPCKLLDNPS